MTAGLASFSIATQYFFSRGFLPHFTRWKDAKNERLFNSFFSCTVLYLSTHILLQMQRDRSPCWHLWQSTTATFANHCSTSANFNASSEDLCEEILFPLHRRATETSRTWFRKHTVILNTECETLRDDISQRTRNHVLGIQRYHVGRKIMCAHVISTRTWCKHARVIWNFHGCSSVCHCPMRICAVASLVICSLYS